MNQREIRILGQKILTAFRDRQGHQGRIGCRCADCANDMYHAVKTVVEKEQLEIIKKTPEHLPAAVVPLPQNTDNHSG